MIMFPTFSSLEVRYQVWFASVYSVTKASLTLFGNPARIYWVKWIWNTLWWLQKFDSWYLLEYAYSIHLWWSETWAQKIRRGKPKMEEKLTRARFIWDAQASSWSSWQTLKTEVGACPSDDIHTGAAHWRWDYLRTKDRWKWEAMEKKNQLLHLSN